MPESTAYIRYMEAFSALNKHLEHCTTCNPVTDQYCETGAPLYATFTKRQDTYNQKRR